MIHRSYRFRSLAALVTCCLLSCCLLPAPAWAQMSQEEALEKYNAMLEQGQQQLEAEEYEEAAATFSEAITASGGASGPGYIGRATARKELKEYAKAQEDLKNFRQYNQSRDPAMLAAASNLSGEIYLEMGALGDALADFEEAVESDSNNPLYQFNLGKVYALAGAPDQGRKALDKWIEAGVDDPEKNAEAYRLRAQTYAQSGKFEDANADIQAALAIDDKDYEVYALQGMIAAIQEDWAAGAEAYRKAIENYEPEEDSDLPYVEGQLQRAAMLEEAAKESEDPEEQRRLFQEKLDESQRLLDALPDRPQLAAAKASALFSRGVAERQLGDLASAVGSFTEAIDLNPGLAQAYFRRGICFFHMGEERMAIDDFDKAASIDFATPHSALWKGRVYAQLGEYYEALKSYAQALAVSDRYTDAYVNRGLVYVQLGEYERAIADFNDAIRLQPTNGQHYYFRGVAYALQGKHDKAVKSLATAVDFDDQLAPAYLKLADELDAIGRSDVAADFRARGNELSNQVSQ
ncbi:lipoprotein NlpI [Posidoniimonas polymericola]|uniref:Lipoprotein NlpI n=2 Tax=Posidoniimonas polymericola TaxID=2528002 RepID=A0A5C5XSQ9_9BACT|nr:lipoprotein NlpI [Posidoniimonas polymericola]